MAKEQIRTTAETADQERSINDHSVQLLRDEMAQVKQNLSEVTRRESQVRCIITFARIRYRARHFISHVHDRPYIRVHVSINRVKREI